MLYVHFHAEKLKFKIYQSFKLHVGDSGSRLNIHTFLETDIALPFVLDVNIFPPTFFVIETT